MASLNEDLAEGTPQDDGANVPRMEILAEEIAETLPINRPAKRKRDKMDTQDNLQDPLQTATEENNGNNAKFSRNWKPPQGIITDKDLEDIYASLGLSSTRINELRKYKAVREIALRKNKDTIDLTEKHQLGAAYLQLTGERAQNPCKECLAGKGPFELCVYGSGRRCGNCWHRHTGNGRCSFQKTGKENGVSEAVSKPSHHADKDASRSDTESVSDLLSEAGIGVGLEHHPEPEPEHQKGGRELRPRPPQPPQPPRRNKKPPQREQNIRVTEPVTQPQARHESSTVFTNPTTNTTPPANAPNSPSIRPGIDTPLSPPPAAATPTRQALPSGVYKPQFPPAVASVVNAQITRERCGCGSRDIRPERQQQIDNNTDPDRDREREREKEKEKEKEREKQREKQRTHIVSDRSFSLGGGASPGPPNSILACLPPNTPVEIMRCLMQYHQNHADELRLECMSIVKDGRGGSRPAMAWGDAGGVGPSSILACLDPNQSPLETMRRLGLHYQYQADELRLECVRIEREERMRRAREREREWERERGGRGGREDGARG
ncbi:hypothetical protein B0H65DRAFT_554146 [Neurospora tetraspora]|uniref:Uncharacterized protein n=1 Tax=Neurospora tetraspora TaxID=94610 RepID=A0AAE0JNC6_9PEZI|nr:hypothetical protein B0H65DRAFT_554146 [Neurospora tetraspora]